MASSPAFTPSGAVLSHLRLQGQLYNVVQVRHPGPRSQVLQLVKSRDSSALMTSGSALHLPQVLMGGGGGVEYFLSGAQIV